MVLVFFHIENRPALYKYKNVHRKRDITSLETENSHCKPINHVITAKVTSDPKIRETTCNCCFPHNFKYLINNKNICKLYTSQQNIDLFIMIFTKHSNFETRKAIRETWLTIAKNNTANVRYVFLLGKVEDVALSKDIAQENEIYKDILKEDFIDTYENQTIKTMMGFKWVVHFCQDANFVMKTDDDTFTNVPNLLTYIKEHGNESKTHLMGSCKQKKPIRNTNCKWYASEADYKEEYYPWHCSGTGYFTSFSMIKQMHEISPYIPFFWLEDIYVSLCFRKTGGTVKGIEGFNIYRQKLDPCLYKGNQLYTSHEVTPEMLRWVWSKPCISQK